VTEAQGACAEAEAGVFTDLVEALCTGACPHLKELSFQQQNGAGRNDACLQSVIRPPQPAAMARRRQGLHALSQLSHLETLHVGGFVRGKELVTSLVEALTGSPLGRHLRSLSLDGSGLGVAGFVALFRALAGGCCPRLEELYLDKARAGDTCMAVVGRALSSAGLARLRVLDLSCNSITSKGAEALVREVLRAQVPVRTEVLLLRSNAIRDEGLEELMHLAASPSAPHLRYLSLSYNAVGCSGLVSAVRHITAGRCSKLELLDLSSNSRLSDRGRSRLAKHLENAPFTRCPVLRLYSDVPTREGPALGIKNLTSVMRTKRFLNVDLSHVDPSLGL
jgi:hypothetical protein